MANPLDLLFVCIGNLCRSPFAEGLARHLSARDGGPALSVGSAGLWAVVGGGVPPDGITAGLSRGVDLRAHRARQLDDELCSAARRIIVMDRHQAHEVEERFGVDAAQVEILARWVPGPIRPEGVPDPYRCGPWAYASSYALIEAAVTELVAGARHGHRVSRSP